MLVLEPFASKQPGKCFWADRYDKSNAGSVIWLSNFPTEVRVKRKVKLKITRSKPYKGLRIAQQQGEEKRQGPRIFHDVIEDHYD